MLDPELIKKAENWADEILDNIYLAINSPKHKLEKDSLKVYKMLESWNWLECCPLNSSENKEDKSRMILKKLLAMQKYDKLKSARDKPAKPKPSKWDIVTGKAKRR